MKRRQRIDKPEILKHSSVKPQRSVLTFETIKQREDLQNSVLKHSNRLIGQLLKNLDEAENVVHRRLSPSHLERLIRYLRDDIQPLRDFITRISLHAEKLGSLRKEYELQALYGERIKEFQASLTQCSSHSESSSSLTRYIIGRDERDNREDDLMADRMHTTPYSTPRVLSPPLKAPQCSPEAPPACQYRSTSCSPIRFDNGDILARRLCYKDSSEQVDLYRDSLDLENSDITQVLEAAKKTLVRKSKQAIKDSMKWLRRTKYKLTGSREFTFLDRLVLLLLLVAMYSAMDWGVHYGKMAYRSLADVRRGVIPM